VRTEWQSRIENESPGDLNLEPVFIAANVREIEFVEQLLQSEGIQYRVRPEPFGRRLPFAGGPYHGLLFEVLASQAQYCRRLLSEAGLTIYESAGKKSSEGMYDPHEWRVKRSVSLVADLAAQATTAMPTLQAIDAAQTAELKSKSDKAQAVATQMAPMMADAEKIMAKCGDDEACITREAQKMAALCRARRRWPLR